MASRTRTVKNLSVLRENGVATARRATDVSRSQRTGRAPAARSKPLRSAPRPGARPKPSPTQSAKPRHLREIGALVLLGIGVFLLFALIATQSAGIVGRGAQVGLTFCFGWLAYLVPLALFALGARLVFSVRLRRSRLVGLGLFLFGLFLFVGAAAPPFGEHGQDLFVRQLFEKRAGGLGEALYAAAHQLTGTVGVGIISWVALVSGFVLFTGITSLWLSMRARQAAVTIRAATHRSALTKERDNPLSQEENLWSENINWPWSGKARGDSDLSNGPDLGHASGSGNVSLSLKVSAPTPFWPPHEETLRQSGTGEAPPGSAFDDWLGTQQTASRVLSTRDISAGAPRLIDGAQAYADLFSHSGPHSSLSAEGQHKPAPPTELSGRAARSEAGRLSPAEVGSSDHVDSTSTQATPILEHTGTHTPPDEVGEGQQTLPGLEPSPSPGRSPERPAWVLPEPYMLRKSPGVSASDGASQRERAAVLVDALAQFGVEARVVGMVVGPRVTRYELQLAPGTKVAKVSALKDDLAYALATTDIRILTPIPGKSAVGVEIPNTEAHWVTLGDIYQDFPRSAGPLMFWLGKDISGRPVYADLTRLPHLLIAGTTGSGKSGCVNCIISSILLRATPDQVRMILIDPKKVELSHYDRIPHLLVPVVTNMKDAAGVLHNAVKEMEDRYELMELDHARSLPELNKARSRRGERPLPYILIVIEELADLMMTSPQEVEDYVIRIAQKARAVGMHLVVATQRPSADVITGMIKANIPSRIAFAVSSQVDSRVILDANGAETLLGAGDMLFKPLGSSHMQRVQGALITEEEIAILVAHWRRQAEPEFREELLRRPEEERKRDDDLFDPDADDLLPEAARLVIETGNASVSMLQRRLRVGYTRAGRLIDMLERRGIVGPWEGSKPRQILVLPEEVEQVVARLEAEQKTPSRRNPD